MREIMEVFQLFSSNFFYNQDKETTFEQVKTVSFRTEDSETFPFPELHNVEELKEDCY